jgi:WD40 repeat protein
MAVTYSPDGLHIAFCSKNGTIKIFDSRTGQNLHTFAEHTTWVYSMAYSPDGQYIVSASEDKTIKIWKNPIIEDRWEMRKPVLLLREKSKGCFNVFDIMTNVASFLCKKTNNRG